MILVLLKVFVLALALGLDALAVAVGIGMSGPARRERLRVAVTFAAVEAALALTGWLAGKSLGAAMGPLAGDVAAVALVALGLWTVVSALQSGASNRPDRPGGAARLTSGMPLIASALTVSLDALAVGFTLPVLAAPPAISVLVIALTGLGLTTVGLAFGRRLGKRVGEGAEVLAGVFLAVTGLVLLAESLRP